MPTYISVGLYITEKQDYQMLNPYIFSLISLEQGIEEVVSIIDREGQGALILINLAKSCIFSEKNWAEIVRQEVVQKNTKINDDINEFYGIED